MAQFQILEYQKIYGIIVQMPKSAMDKIVSPPEESVLFFFTCISVSVHPYLFLECVHMRTLTGGIFS